MQFLTSVTFLTSPEKDLILKTLKKNLMHFTIFSIFLVLKNIVVKSCNPE